MILQLDPIEQDTFSAWVQQVLKPRLLARQISADVFDRALGTVRFRPDVLEKQANQKEFSLPVRDYLEIAASEERARRGRQMLRKHRDLFNRLEKVFGVESEVVTAIWGLETGYGAVRGNIPVIAALATLVFHGSRQGYFEDELVAALRILQSGDCHPASLYGSWAGAIGHGQFMPSSALEFAVDFDGDGLPDLCADDPTDALASIGNYLAKHGWTRGQPWGFAVALPVGFDYALSGLDQALPSRDWTDLGVTMAGAEPLPDYGPGSVLLPAGAQGVALMVLRNFHVLLRYNKAESYAIGIGLLADRIAGGRPITGPWPQENRALTRDEISDLQGLLARAGFDPQGADGLTGPNTTRALRAWQQANGLVPDGYVSQTMLELLRAGARNQL